MTTTIGMTKIFLLKRGANVNLMRGWRGDFYQLSEDRSNNDFIEIVEKSNVERGDNECRYIKKDFVMPDDDNYDNYDFKNNCFFTGNINVLEIPIEYYEKKWYEIKNKCNGEESQYEQHYGSYYFDVYDDEELVLFHEKCKLSKMDSSQKQKIILLNHTLSTKYSISDIYEQYISEKAQDGILIPEMTDLELRTNSEFIKWIEDIQSDDTEKNLENKIINIYRLLYIEKKIDISRFDNIEMRCYQGNDRFIEWVKDYREFRLLGCYENNVEFIEWVEKNQHFNTILKYQRSLMFKRTFEIAEIDIKIFNSNCFFIETSSNHKENVIIEKDKYSLYKYINTGKNIIQDTSTNPEKKVELLTEFMSNIIENSSSMFDSLNERADFFPGYGDKYFDALKRWKLNVDEQES